MVNNDLRSLWEQRLADQKASGKRILGNQLTDWQYWLKNHSI